MAKARSGVDLLDRGTLVRVAAGVADRDGWSRLTLSSVAKDVDRHVTSLYAHVDSLDALRREVALLALQELADDVWRAALGRIRQDALAAIAEVYRDFARSFPGRAAAIAAVSHEDDPELRVAGARLAEPIRATFASFGLDHHQAVIAHRVFSATITGLVRAEATHHDTDTDSDETFRRAVELFVAGLSSGAWPGP